MQSTPFFNPDGLPRYAEITADRIAPLVSAALAEHGRVMSEILSQPHHDVANTLVAKEKADVATSVTLSTIGHLSSVCDTPEYRDAYNAVQPQISDYFSALNQNVELLAALREAGENDTVSPAEKRALTLSIQDFELSGVGLPDAERARYSEIVRELSELTTAYANAALDATDAWSQPVTEDQLAGLPDYVVAMMAAAAAEQGATGWLATLAPPVSHGLLSYAEDRNLRHDVYRANATRASDLGPHAGQFDNADRMVRILTLRRELAQLVGFPDFVAYSLVTKTADNADQVLNFLSDLADRIRPVADKELAELRAFAKANLDLEDLQPWDMAFASERLRQERHNVDASALTRYFPLDRVMAGLFDHVEHLFGVTLRDEPAGETWHPDVRRIAVSADGETLGYLLLDLHARSGKQSGAWMQGGRSLLRDADEKPFAYLTCNFAPKVGDTAPLLRHDDVVTLFHEMGHSLHHLLTEIDLPSIGGVAVEWDAVELPSQFHESFAWDPSVLRLVSAHTDTGEPLPAEIGARMIAARGFQAALGVLRQVELATVDLRLHLLETPSVAAIDQIVRDTNARFSPFVSPEWNRYTRTFTHIFAGAYAAGYYSYLWAERLSSDAYEAFTAVDADRAQLGRLFRTEVLAQGGSRPAQQSFVAFRGREPENDALLRQRGLAA